jgi:parvulin-like peptidyl-prolyl isomerase
VALIDNNEAITLAEFQAEYKQGKSKQALESADLNTLKTFLDEMIGRRLITSAAYEMGLDKDSTIVAKMEPFRIQTLLKELHSAEIMSHIIKESDFRDFYTNTAKEVLIRTIFFSLPRNAPSEKEKEVTERALDILKRIQVKEDYEKLAKEFSEDPETAPNGGRLGYVTWDRSDDPIKKKAWTMRKGQVSDLVRNNTGLHIIRVDDIREKERKPFEEAKKDIESQLRLERGSQIRDMSKGYWEKLMKTNKVKWHDEEIDTLLNYFKDPHQATAAVLYDTLSQVPTEKKSRILASYRNGEVTIQDLQNTLQRVSSRHQIDKKTIQLIIGDNILMVKMLLERAEQLGLDKEKETASRLQRSLEWYMREKFLREEIYGEIEPTDQDIQDFYEQTKNEKYVVDEQVNVREIMVRDEELSKEIGSWVKKGQDFATLAEKYTERRGYKKKKGELGFFREGNWGAVGRKAFDLKKGEIAGPFPLDDNKGYSIIQLLDRKPSRIKLLDEVRETVRNDYINQMKKEREEVWAGKRREKVRVQIFNDVLEKAFAKM